MRVISGKYKGHHLVSFKADHIRPTTDRVKETLFNKIQFELEGSTVLDLFSGTGSLGIEAISRGASLVHFVDDNLKSIDILKKNIEKLKIDKNLYKIIQMDAIKFIKKENQNKYNFILIDPPFTKEMADTVMNELGDSKWDLTNSLITIESIKQETLNSRYSSLVCVDQKDYGDKKLSFFRKVENEET